MQWTPGNASYTYDGDGYLYKLEDTGVSRKIFYQTDMFGQVLSRKEWNVSPYQATVYNPGAGRDFVYLNERAIGDVGTDSLANRIDYATQLANDKTASNAVTQAWGTYSSATPVVGINGNIDINYEAFNAASVDQSSASFTALGGESLQDVAQNLLQDRPPFASANRARLNGSAGRTLVPATGFEPVT